MATQKQTFKAFKDALASSNYTLPGLIQCMQNYLGALENATGGGGGGSDNQAPNDIFEGNDDGSGGAGGGLVSQGFWINGIYYNDYIATQTSGFSFGNGDGG